MLPQVDANAIKLDAYERALHKAERRLTSLRESMRSEASSEMNYYAADILQVILGLRQALE